MAKKKNNQNSPSLNDKSKNKRISSSTASKGGKNKDAATGEAEFLKEEFANEYAERAMLIDEVASEESTLKSTDEPKADLTAEVNVDLSVELGKADSEKEIQSVESIPEDEGGTFTLQIEPEMTPDDNAECASDEGNIPAPVELTLGSDALTDGEVNSEAAEESAADTSGGEAGKPNIEEEVIGFDFGEKKDTADKSTPDLDTPVADDSDTDEAAAINLSDSLKESAEGDTAKEDEVAEQNGNSESDSEEKPSAKKPRARKSKKSQKGEIKDENDTTIIDAVAKEIEDEARQTLIQRIMQADITEESATEPECDSEVIAEDGAVDSLNNEIDPQNEQADDSCELTEENKKGEIDEEGDSPSDNGTKELLSEEEEYRRALAIRDKRLKKAKSVFDFLELFIFTLVAVLLVTTFFVRHSIVDGDSMLGTLKDGQSLLVSNFMYEPECGDIIVVEDYTTQLKKPIVKRIIAVGGQTVKIARHGVYVDGVLLDEPYVFTDGAVYEYDVVPSDALLENETLVVGYNYYELVVPEGELFVMGDHRNMSMDSRAIGTVRADAIIGKVLVRIAPFDEFKFFN